MRDIGGRQKVAEVNRMSADVCGNHEAGCLQGQHEASERGRVEKLM